MKLTLADEVQDYLSKNLGLYEEMQAEDVTNAIEKQHFSHRGRIEATERVISTLLRSDKEQNDAVALTNTLTQYMTKMESPGKRNSYAWGHSVCHLFENYGRVVRIKEASNYGEPSKEHLLQEEYLESAHNLANEHVIRAIHLQEEICVERTLGAIARFNFDQFTNYDAQSRWKLRPDTIDATDENSVFLSETMYNDLTRIYVESKTPRDFARGVLEEVPRMSQEGLIGILQYVQRNIDSFDAETVGGFAEKILQEPVQSASKGLKAILGNIEEAEKYVDSQSGEVEVNKNEVYVDVEGTLLDSNGDLNESLYETVQNYAKKRDVFIVTGGDPTHLTNVLREQGVAEEYLPVGSKSDLRGKAVSFMVDDIDPMLQGIYAKDWSKAEELW